MQNACSPYIPGQAVCLQNERPGGGARPGGNGRPLCISKTAGIRKMAAAAESSLPLRELLAAELAPSASESCSPSSDIRSPMEPSSLVERLAETLLRRLLSPAPAAFRAPFFAGVPAVPEIPVAAAAAAAESTCFSASFCFKVYEDKASNESFFCCSPNSSSCCTYSARMSLDDGRLSLNSWAEVASSAVAPPGDQGAAQGSRP
mmetsp:Transcript_86121/g.219452  ORF Transcript_86121/g.219452 Transcript_86121/m.219452 type:complete len:204 (+) Transcript_86121:281-892(+)